MSAHDHLLRPVRLRRLIFDVVGSTAFVEAETDVGSITIDMHELHAMEGGDLIASLSNADKKLIDRYLTAAARTFE